MSDAIGRLIGFLAMTAILYLLFDVFFWSGGLVSNPIFKQLSDSVGVIALPR